MLSETQALHTRRSVMVAGMATLGMFAAGCVPGTSSNESDAKSDDPKFEGDIEFWTINLKKNYNDYITGLINKYQTEHPKIKVNWIDVPGADIGTKLLAAIASGAVPDAVNIDTANLGQFLPSLTDLNDYLADADLADYQSNLVEPLRTDGKLHAVPWYNGGAPVGVYRKSAMSKVGFDAGSPPKSFDEALALAQQVYNASKVYGFNAIPDSQVLQYYGVTMLSEDRKKAAFNTDDAVAVLEKFKRSYDSRAIAPGAVSKDVRNYPQSLENSQIAFTPSSLPFTLLNVQKNAPNVYSDLVVTKAVTTSGGKYLLAGQQTFAVPRASKHKQAAVEFIKYFTNGENQLAFCKLVPIYPSTISSTKDSYFTSIDPGNPQDASRKVIVDELPDLQFSQLGTTKDAELAEYLADQVRGFLQGQKNAKDALSAAEKQWNDALAGTK